MTVRTWPQLTQAEKIEDLRRDVVHIFKSPTENQDAIGPPLAAQPVTTVSTSLKQLEGGKDDPSLQMT
jgi:hypothetical protein